MLLIIAICAALASCLAPADAPVPTDARPQEAGPRFVSTKTGAGLSLNMESAQVSKIFGKPNESGWYTTYDKSVIVLSIDDRVKGLTFYGGAWKTGDGIAVGTHKETIRDFYGKPDDESENDPKLNLGAMDMYRHQSGDTNYTLVFAYDEEELVKQIDLTLDIASEKILGTITLQENGEGNAVIKDLRSIFGVFDIFYEGGGPFIVRAFDGKGKEKIIVNSAGAYHGRLVLPNFFPYSLQITSGGRWSITAKNSSKYVQKANFKGAGDYVTDSFTLTAEACKWSFSRSGEGPFSVKLRVNNRTETLVETSGAYSGIVSSNLFTGGVLSSANHAGYGAYFEVLGSGEWKIEQVK